MENAWQTAFQAREDLKIHGSDAIGLFALALKFNLEDLESVAADSITGGSDDKKADIVYINKEEKFAVIAQCYQSKKTQRKSAKANKASDLNTAIGWLLQREESDLPASLLSAARELRSAIGSDDIDTIHIWYVHNLPESENVEKELKTVEASAKAALHRKFSTKEIRVVALEVGQNKLTEWYQNSKTPILVNAEFTIEIEGGYEIKGPRWKAFATSISAQFLHDTYKKYTTQLFSANVRDYLGSRSSDSNINNAIKITAEKEHENFWPFNNGLTVLVNSFKETAQGGKRNLVFDGMSIVNGAQTSGAIGSLDTKPKTNTFIQTRFIQTSDKDLIQKIIQFNNSQNQVTASDFRSTHPIQKRLKEEITKIPSAEYEGGRRGGAADAIQRRTNLIPSYTAGQALTAFHGNPIIAYNKKTEIWANDKYYSDCFNDRTTGVHLVFTYSLLRSVENKKFILLRKEKENESKMTTLEKEQIEFFRQRGSIYLFVTAVSACLETILGHSIDNKFRLSFGGKVSPSDAQLIWENIIEVVSPLASQLEGALSDGLKNNEKVTTAVKTFSTLIDATKTGNKKIYDEFSKKVLKK